MFKFIVFFIMSFCLSFLILSFPIQKKSLFYHLSEVVSPITDTLYERSEKVIKNGSKVFKNADPPNKRKKEALANKIINEISDEDKKKVEKLFR